MLFTTAVIVQYCATRNSSTKSQDAWRGAHSHDPDLRADENRITTSEVILDIRFKSGKGSIPDSNELKLHTNIDYEQGDSVCNRYIQRGQKSFQSDIPKST